MANLTEVAKRANVSVATASLVLNRGKGWQRISDSCAERVRTAADDLDYATNYHMRSMRRGKADVLGLVIDPDQVPRRIGEAGLFELMRGMTTACSEAGVDVMSVCSESRQRAFDRGVLGVRERKLDALVVPCFDAAGQEPQLLEKLRALPLVAVEPIDAGPLPSLCVDYDAAIDLLLRHLAELGHRQVLWLEVGHDKPTASPRQAQALPLADAHHLELVTPQSPRATGGGEDKLEAVAAALAEYLERSHDERATAVFCADHESVIVAQRALWQTRLRTPEDVSLVALRPTDPACAAPSITTVDHGLRQMGYAAAQLAIRCAELTEAQRLSRQDHVQILQPSLVQGQTTGPVLATHR